MFATTTSTIAAVSKRGVNAPLSMPRRTASMNGSRYCSASAAACSCNSVSWAAAVQNSMSIRQVATFVDRPRSTIATNCCQGSSNRAANSSIAATATDVARLNASISMSSREPK